MDVINQCPVSKAGLVVQFSATTTVLAMKLNEPRPAVREYVIRVAIATDPGDKIYIFGIAMYIGA